jgi:opacity protein-like surface antigen
MKKIPLLFGIASLVFSSLAIAQSKNFEGIAVGFNTGFDSTALKLTATDGSGTYLDGFGKSNFTSNINGSYTFAVSESATLAVSASYNLVDSKIFTEDENGSFTAGSTLKLKSQYSISVEPGYALNDSTLGYVKFGYHSADYKVATISKSTNGFGYGLGVKYLITPNVYANLEILKVDYSSTSIESDFSGKTTNTIGTVGIGYKF